MDEELCVRLYLESDGHGGQWLYVQEISDKWCPSGISTGTTAL